MVAGLPVLYSFRRCPYAMRARLALAVSGQQVEHREVVLRNKPPELLAASPKGTVPVLVLAPGEVIEQSLDVMLWALRRDDPEGWLSAAPLDGMLALIAGNDGEFKQHPLRKRSAPRVRPGLASSKPCWSAAGYAAPRPAWPTWRCCLL
jgi:glutathione S-transferase